MYYQSDYDSAVGKITMASNGESLVGLWIEGQKYFCDSVREPMQVHHALPVFEATKKWLDRYFAGQRPVITDLPLAPSGSVFRQMVWKILCEIPYGETTTYGEIAKKMAILTGRKTMSAQAVGGAVSHNPISIVIPCHRVVGSGGSLTGYAGGIDKKIQLLQIEGVDTTKFSMP
ncbi:MAG: methylated-DNA--[protein]-cysteine S-methyltransferase [Lachnospiraceae bacterium]|nr:methylated-DNA--[protein]-cysteine S-methyltransferase [Lachnospiraceae bacterium]